MISETELKPCATNLEAMIVAYGKLWRDVPSTHKAVQARMILKDRLTHAERKQGIQFALEEYGPPTEHDILTLDHTRTPDTAQSEFANDSDVVETIHARSYEKGFDDGQSRLLLKVNAQLLKDKEELMEALTDLVNDEIKATSAARALLARLTGETQK